MELPTNALDAFIKANLQAYLTAAAAKAPAVVLPALAAGNVVSGFLDPDFRQDPLAVFIVPDSEAYTELTLGTTEAEYHGEIYIMVRKADPALLAKQTMRIIGAMNSMFKAHPTLDGAVAELEITNSEMYWGVDGDAAVKGAKLDVQIKYEVQP
jgi:hypothetical protein